MQVLFIDKKIKYSGKQLSPHWIYKNFNIMGNAVVAFIGECDVKLDNMVDIEDVINKEPIYSKEMLNIIEENFNSSLIETVYKQRLLVTLAKELLEKKYPDVKIERSGDDLFVNGRKLSVSIPIKASDLVRDVGVKDIKKFANQLLLAYKEEVKDINFAASKVRGVF